MPKTMNPGSPPLAHVSLCVCVLSGNAAARRFYERPGALHEKGEYESTTTLGGIAYDQTTYGWVHLADFPTE